MKLPVSYRNGAEKLAEDFGLVRAPSFYFEAIRQVSSDKSAFRFESVYLFARNPNTRAATLHLDFAKPAAATTAFAQGDFVFESLKPPAQLVSRGDLTDQEKAAFSYPGKATPWMPVRPLDTETAALLATQETELAEFSTLRLRLETEDLTDEERRQSEKRKNALERSTDSRAKLLTKHSPFNLTVSLTETKDIEKWLATLAEILEESKAEVNTAVADHVLPSRRAAIEQTQNLGALDQEKAYQVALSDVRIAELALDKAEATNPPDSEDVAAKEKAVFEKKMDANRKAVEAGKSLPFPELLA